MTHFDLTFAEELGRRLRAIREAKGLRQQEVSNRMGCDRSQVYFIELPRRIGIRTFLRYCYAIGVPPHLALQFDITPRAVAEMTLAAGEHEDELIPTILRELNGLSPLQLLQLRRLEQRQYQSAHVVGLQFRAGGHHQRAIHPQYRGAPGY